MATVIDVLLAASPLLVAMATLLVLQWPAGLAGGLGCLLAVGLGLLHPSFALTPDRMPLALLRGLLVALLVAYVVFFGLLLHELTARGRALARLSRALAAAGGGPVAGALVLCLPLGAFFEAVSGFGVGIVIVAPLLLALGFPRQRAALLALLTQNAVPWGAMAVGTLLGAELAGLAPTAIGVGVAYLNVPLFLYFGLLVVVLAGGWNAMRQRLALAVAMGAGMAAVAWWGTVLLGVELAMVVGGPLVAAIGLLWLRRQRAGSGADGASEEAVHLPPLGRALAPYVVLVAGLLASRLLDPLRGWLQGNVVLSVPHVSFSLPLLYSPGFWLAIACVATVPLLRLSRGEVLAALATVWRRWLRTAVALAAFLVLSEVMLRGGMTERLALAMAAALGPAYVVAVPLIGGLGGFLTGSNAASNALFMHLQLQAAEALGVAPLVVAAAQNTAGAALSLASPQRVVLVTAVVGLAGKEGELTRAALLVGAGVVVLVALAELAWLGGVGALLFK
ncbi:MAG TPA: L-lactate permease [Chloroflexota bacterium]